MTAYWIMDAWNSEEVVHLWLRDADGKNHFLEDVYYPRLEIRTFSERGKRIATGLCKSGILRWQESKQSIDLWTGKQVSSTLCRILQISAFRKLFRETDFVRDHIEFYGADLLPVHGYLLEQNTFPLAKVRILPIRNQKLDWGGAWKIETLTDRFALERDQFPALKTITMFADFGKYVPIGPKNPIRVLASETEMIRLDGSPQEILTKLNLILQEVDPDILFTNGGDEFLLPQIFTWAKEFKIALLLDRETTTTFRNLKTVSRTFYSYGRVVHKTTAFPLFGRIHLDKRESFFYTEADLEGIYEMARFSRLPLQRLSRSSPGTAMSAMEDETALFKNTLIPRIKGKAPSIKPLSVLLKTDQGGMTFRPKVGYFENIVEMDFRSLYPSIMSVHNISGETVNCECCDWDGVKIPVPETPYHTCTKRRGIVSDTVEILLRRRDEIKEFLNLNKDQLSEEDRKAWDRRSTALKWCLVTCFGYTGYKNAKYGRREAHESITAWGRYAIQSAKEIAEDMGYEFLHGLTDSLWLVSKDTKLLEQDAIQELHAKVKNKLSLRLLYEASYSWIVFPTSKAREGFSVPTRYYGREVNGKIKYRGIALRRRNTPILVDHFQEELIGILSLCANAGEIRKHESEFDRIHRFYRDGIRKRSFPLKEFMVTQNLTRRSGDYKGRHSSKIVLDALLEEGVVLEGGQKIEYIVCNRTHPIHKERYKPYHQFRPESDPIDIAFYEGLLLDAWSEVLGIFFPESGELFGKTLSNLSF
ncbi:MAG: hypothetical protein O9346_05535 [Leptospiraceae bacterium]|nr:hypothetical protein [Leptospiraceae bacterium]MCZ8345859.1 hypothetical protein [Leptospiraceae bacterium]